MSLLVLVILQGLSGLELAASRALPHDPTTVTLLVLTVAVWTAHFALQREIKREVARAEQRQAAQPRSHW